MNRSVEGSHTVSIRSKRALECRIRRKVRAGGVVSDQSGDYCSYFSQISVFSQLEGGFRGSFHSVTQVLSAPCAQW